MSVLFYVIFNNQRIHTHVGEMWLNELKAFNVTDVTRSDSGFQSYLNLASDCISLNQSPSTNMDYRS